MELRLFATKALNIEDIRKLYNHLSGCEAYLWSGGLKVMSKESEKTITSDKESKEIPKNILEALIRLVWPSRYKAVWLIFFALVIGLFTFFGGLPTELILKPFFSEKIRVIKYDSQLQLIKSVKLVQSADPQKNIEGISLLQELAISYPYKRQELINFLQEYLRKTFPQNKEIDKKYLPVLEHAIRTITTIPRHDDNGYPLNIDIHQIRIEHLDLANTNFEGISLWGGQFIDVTFSRSNFKNADLGGTQFTRGGLEYAKFEGAKITGSFMDQENGRARPTRFIKTRLYGSTLEKAMIDNCELIGINDFQVDMLKKCTIK